MSGRRRRPEALWDRKEEDEISGGKIPWQGKESLSNFRGDGSPKRSNSEANDAFMPRDYSREPMHRNENMPMDPDFDEWENQYSSRPSDHAYGLPYRGGDRGVGGTGNMSKDRDRSRSRSWSPHRSGRGWDRDRGNARGRERSRSRSRGRDPGRGGRSPFDDERRELYESADVRNDSRVSSRQSRGGGNRSDNDLTEKWSRPEYSSGSRFRDDRNSADRPRTKGSDGYRKDTTRNRNAYDDQDHRRGNQSTKPLPCRFFLMGNCNRNNCKYSHDAPKPGSDDRPWNERQPQDHASASRFSDFQKSNHNFDDNSKPWNGPTWDDLESGGFDQVSREHILDDRSQSVIPEISGRQFTNVTTTTMPQGDSSVDMVIDNPGAYNLVSADTNQQFRSYDNMTSQFPSTLTGTEKSSDMFPNGPKLQLNGSAQGMLSHLDLQKPVEVQNQQGGEPLETCKSDTPVSLPQISQKQIIANALEFLYSLPNAAQSGAPVDSTVVSEAMKTIVPMVPMSNSLEPENQISVEPISVPKTKQESLVNIAVNENREAENPKGQPENTNPGKSETQGKVEEGNIGNDEKAMRQFKVALVEFVKDILKPTWKEGKMSREVYKTIVKKVVDKVTSTIQGNQIPRTQEKIDQYLAFSKTKITKLVEAYVGRFLKA